MADQTPPTLPADLADLAPHLDRPCVVVLMGASGAGKSWLADRIAAAAHGEATSYDAIRLELTGDPYAHHANTEAVELCRARARYRLDEGVTTVVDATHTHRPHRLPWVQIAADHGVTAHLVGVLTPLSVCLARQQDRLPYVPGTNLGRRVPGDVVRAQHAEVTRSVPDLHTEGWTTVHLVGNAALDATTATATEGTR